ncbi:MAG: DoxX family protein [Balneola sp.]
MKHLPTIARYLLGLIFFVFGLNGFLQFLPQPELGADAGAFMGALAATGYFFPFLKIVEVVSGILLLSNRFVTVALAMLAPVTVNIVAFHAFLDPAGLPVGILAFILNIYLLFAYKKYYDPMLTSKPELNSGDSE